MFLDFLDRSQSDIKILYNFKVPNERKLVHTTERSLVLEL
jgi:hypothetical protein